MKHWLAILVMTSLTPAGVSQTSTHLCTVRYSDEVRHVSPTGVTFIAVPGFVLGCRGSIQGSLQVTGNRISHTRLQLEKSMDGNWTVVAHGNTLSYKAEPGRYRISVAHTGEKGGLSSWVLRYSKPLP